jgi:hypothetical protein
MQIQTAIAVPEDDIVQATVLLYKKDLKILSQDSKAVHLLEETDKVFRDRYKAFVELKKRSSSV